MTDITIFAARRIITMNSYLPDATHVAVREGRVLGVGDLDTVKGFGEYSLDDRFAGKVLMPGFVEGHCHAKEGGMWDYPYIGYLDRRDPDGGIWPGCGDLQSSIDRLI